MPLGFVDKCLFDGPEAVQVLDLDDRRGDFLAVFVDVEVDVGIAAQRTFLHLAVGDFEVAKSQPQLLQAAAGIGRAADFGLGDDLQERNPRPVQIDFGKAAVAVRQLAGVFLEVNPGQIRHRPPPPPSFRTGISRCPPRENGRSYWLI